MQTGIIFDIQRFCLHDGPGVRTTVFFKGCPLRCIWCSNPESQRQAPEVFYIQSKCVGCFRCQNVCPAGCIERTGDGYIDIDRSKCTDCLECAKACFSGAIVCKGKTWTVDEVVNEVVKDKLFFKNTNGGVTLSGGEVLAQADFALAILKELKKKGIHTAIETTGYGDTQALLDLASVTDLVLYDFKHHDEQLHEKYTGVSNKKIMINLQTLIQRMGMDRLLVRVPLIPGFNSDNKSISGIKEALKDMGITSVELIPFHQLGKKKYEYLGREYFFGNAEAMSEEAIKTIKESFVNDGFILV